MADKPAGFSLGGLLGNALENPLFNLGIGLLGQPRYSYTPRGPLEGLAGGLQYATAAQRAASENALNREKLALSRQQATEQAKLQELIKGGGLESLFPGVDAETLATMSTANPDLLGKLVKPPLSALEQATLAAAYPGLRKAETEATNLEDLGKIEEVTANTVIDNAIEADQLITRLDKGPVPLGGVAASIAQRFADKETGLISVPPSKIAQAIAAATGEPFSPELAKQFQTDWNRLTKLSAKFISDQRALQAQQGATQGARQTDMGLGIIQAQNISPGITGDANRLILRDLVKRQFDIGRIRGWKLPNAQRGEELLKRYDTDLVPYTEPNAPQLEGPAAASTPPLDMSGAGVQNGQLVPQPQPQYIAPPAAPAPAPAPAPTPRKTGTLKLGSDGRPTYKRKADAERDAASGKLDGFDYVVINGQRIPLEPEGG